MNKLNLQMHANETFAADLVPAISIDFTSRISDNIAELQRLLGVTEMIPMAAGTTINVYKLSQVNTPNQVAEGVTIPLTEIKREVAKTITIGLNKFRKNTSAEAIQKVGSDMAINMTDEKLMKGIRKGIKTDFYTVLKTGTGTAGGATLQATLADVWGKVQKVFEDEEVTPIYFVSTDDLATYLGSANITLQSAFGMSYIEDFMGLGTVVVTPALTQGKVIGTAKENLNGAFVPANTGDVAKAFGLTSDETGLVGMTHAIKSDNATIDTLAFSGVTFFPELLDAVVVGTISAA